MSDETHDHEHDEADDSVEVMPTPYLFVVYVDENGGHVGVGTTVGGVLVDINSPEGVKRVMLEAERPAGADDLARGSAEVLRDVEQMLVAARTAQMVVQYNMKIAEQMQAQARTQQDVEMGKKLIQARG